MLNLHIETLVLHLGEEPKQEEAKKPVLLLTLPEFRRAYALGQKAYAEAMAEDRVMTDANVMEELRRLVNDGFFTQKDESDIQFAIGNLLGFLSAGQ